MTRAWFRRRLDDDPRRWVLLLAALEGPCAFALRAVESQADLKAPAARVWLLIEALMPVVGVLGMIAHGRLLWWTGALLGGRARPVAIHAAFAWSALPFVVTAAPVAAYLPLLLTAQRLDPPPNALQSALHMLDAASGVLVVLAALAALVGALLYIRFLGEAQGFSPLRALVNHLLALGAAVGLVMAGLGAGTWLGAAGIPRALLGFAIAAALGACVEVAVQVSRRRQARHQAEPGA